ncbi:adenosylcobinamide-phosphate synthase CbiB [Sulfurivermis fontis]|uniref:adenosylcobinamide-phosphate synthase CbiB n=1 Tax=Sulfurivermis fontis TaxID=1972068 RepID=UPI0015588BA3|nr:adenosylcobinamide-phosphate synthase CbiB [Sulfurivermis fontis]
MGLAVVGFCAVLLDLWLGEPRRYHPLVGFGRLAAALETRLNRRRRTQGVLVLLLAVLPLVLVTAVLAHLPHIGVVAEVLLLYLAIGATSLAQHGRAVAAALAGGDLALARQRVGWMVSRDTAALDEAGVARAATESVLENGNDAIFGALFWFVVLGAPGAVLYRLVNTLDAMWGYRNERYAAFGWAAARLDDVLNWIPARLTALSYALLGDGRRALRCWYRQGHRTSPNAGVVMAAGAGALGLQLGGPASYHGSVEERPLLGEGGAPGAVDILRAIRLVQHSLWLWLGAIVVLDLAR